LPNLCIHRTLNSLRIVRAFYHHKVTDYRQAQTLLGTLVTEILSLYTGVALPKPVFEASLSKETETSRVWLK
jgi:hypothetical protein